MSQLHPGGCRYGAGRVFGAENIRRTCMLGLKSRDYYAKGRTSIAQGNRHGGPHLHKREIERRRRQQARHG